MTPGDAVRKVKMKTILTLIGIVASLAAASSAQAESSSSIEGVWRVTEESYEGATVSNNSHPQPGLLILTKGYFSFVRVTVSKPRPLFKTMIPTPEEKLTAFDEFTASSGTYELVGTTLTIRPIVAKHPNFMVGGWEKYEIRVEEGTLWLMAKSTDIHMRVGEQIEPMAGGAVLSRRKLVRLE